MEYSPPAMEIGDGAVIPETVMALEAVIVAQRRRRLIREGERPGLRLHRLIGELQDPIIVAASSPLGLVPAHRRIREATHEDSAV